MDDWRINEKYRKPRKAKGTPFYSQRNYYALGVIAVGTFSWLLLELLPGTKRLRKEHKEGDLFNLPEGLETKIKHIQVSQQD